MAKRNDREEMGFALANVGVMLRAGLHCVRDASDKKYSAVEKAALARIEICLMQACMELNRLDMAPAQQSPSNTADVLSFETRRRQESSRMVTDATSSNPSGVGLLQ